MQQAISQRPGKGQTLLKLSFKSMPGLVSAEPESGGIPGYHGAGQASPERQLPKSWRRSCAIKCWRPRKTWNLSGRRSWDRLKAIEALGQKQLVTAGSLADTDVIGFDQTAAKSCFVVLHYSGGISWIKSTKSTRSRTIRRRRCPVWSSSTIWRGASPRKSFYSRWRWRTAAFSQI